MTNDEKLLQQLASDVARLMDERAALESRIGYWVGRCVEQEAQLIEASRQMLELLATLSVARDASVPLPAPKLREAGPTLGEPGDALAGQEAAA